MPQPKKGPSLGASPKHQNLMLSNLALSLFEHERIKTTQAKARLLRPFAERLITKAKKGTVHHRRQVLSLVQDRDVVHKLFDDIAPRFTDRNGGYTRILKLGPRNGDGAPMALIELVEEATAAPVVEGDEEEEEGRRRLRRPVRRRGRRGLPSDKPVRSRAADAAAAGAEEAPEFDEDEEEAEGGGEEASPEAGAAEPESPESVEHQRETGDEAPPDDQEKRGR